ncbi:bifunctional precorrin-2 dehydrogenase/sirohydrochlorin ferrochelatase [Bifidobacterium sp. 82T24]|uniref:precorrin-2 dehydrogenase/sirohydrochlorin ferrochelatase family protein n=1 Tax=Bifidobacterium pluvialisilvae TaxID=2834436 RepID=UPI001C569E93|nr:bifunctional precorrin-2 dehydrogenase/sirohydrochlorin ferrochelatase [Bifidobacterium pluvialisilvae]MBW3088378.1 bifunctional precorrin-2 dehydrogenase/sirohydrochlorin ferrochelatase [Bifidobacterium pluvialisilvae]
MASGLPEHPYPVNIDMRGRLAFVVGGGAVAARKVGTLLHCGAKVVVISPALDPRIDRSRVDWREKSYKSGDILAAGDGMAADVPFVVLACTDDANVNAQVVRDAQAAGVPLTNNVGDPAQSDFYNVAKIETDDCLLTVSTKGRDPARARRLKQELCEWVGGMM